MHMMKDKTEHRSAALWNIVVGQCRAVHTVVHDMTTLDLTGQGSAMHMMIGGLVWAGQLIAQSTDMIAARTG